MGFSEFLGNEAMVAALRGALRSERVPHAMLFTGPRGVGKFTLARMFAQAANCEQLKRTQIVFSEGSRFSVNRRKDLATLDLGCRTRREIRWMNGERNRT